MAEVEEALRPLGARGAFQELVLGKQMLKLARHAQHLVGVARRGEEEPERVSGGVLRVCAEFGGWIWGLEDPAGYLIFHLNSTGHYARWEQDAKGLVASPFLASYHHAVAAQAAAAAPPPPPPVAAQTAAAAAPPPPPLPVAAEASAAAGSGDAAAQAAAERGGGDAPGTARLPEGAGGCGERPARCQPELEGTGAVGGAGEERVKTETVSYTHLRAHETEADL
eukprot:2473936-Rhodomonas_salina.1